MRITYIFDRKKYVRWHSYIMSTQSKKKYVRWHSYIMSTQSKPWTVS